MKKKLLFSALGTLATAAAYTTLLRPRLLTWGATEEEVQRAMLGEELVDNPIYRSTRAITIDNSPENIWPWIVQMGEQRGGFYSYDFIDRLLGMKLHSAHRILPRYQQLQTSDALDRKGNLVVRDIDPEHALVIGPGEESQDSMNFAWTIALYPIDQHRTRLISRVRANFDRTNPRALLFAILLDPGQFIMEQKFLRQLKIHGEGRGEKWPPEKPATLH